MNKAYQAKKTKLYLFGIRHLHEIPQRIIAMQLTIMKTNPVRIVVFNVNGEMIGVLSFRCNARNPHPTPTSRLNAGPAKHPVVAIFGSCKCSFACKTN